MLFGSEFRLSMVGWPILTYGLSHFDGLGLLRRKQSAGQLTARYTPIGSAVISGPAHKDLFVFDANLYLSQADFDSLKAFIYEHWRKLTSI
ncbi:hypothetical protein [Candidatus Cyanaurora vandensis]|uniref:hypothetical protein n=1 Tax=Candidatus Cyanaurora vandensis TaxID=2714958 RepID=UPI002579F7F4|nr:hypothetical protein [Candidatus Cyanaurora vandensis]